MPMQKYANLEICMHIYANIWVQKWPCPLPWKRLWSVQFINFDFCYAWIKCKPDIHDTLWLYKLIIHYQGNREVETLSVFTCFATLNFWSFPNHFWSTSLRTGAGAWRGKSCLCIWRLVDLILPKQNGWKHIICAVKPLLHLLPWHQFSSNISLTTDCIPRTHRIT